MQLLLDTVIFQNKEYRTRTIELPESGNVIISTASLNNALMTDTGNYVSDEASALDETIYYFVEDHEIDLSEEVLIELVGDF